MSSLVVSSDEMESLAADVEEEAAETFFPSQEWNVLSSVKMNDLHAVSKLRCSGTGMDVVHAKVSGPHIHCYWIIPHRLDDSLGIPHILQNLLWKGGSKRYPCPGLLEKIAKQSFSSGLKSKAFVDHSCYSMAVAGKEAFVQLFPVVFDHIFDPELQEATFLQEVYQMDSDGFDSGNCLESILKIEKDPEAVATRELFQSVFGDESSYSCPSNGTSEALRSLGLNATEKVVEFHKKFYHLSNCCLVVCGDLERDELCLILDTVMAPYISPEYSEVKPWSDVNLIPPIPEPVLSHVEYPSDDENEKTVVKVGILGPHSTEKLNRCVAIRLVLEYLVSGPLPIAFQEFSNSFSYPGGSLPIIALSVSEYELKQTLFSIDVRNMTSDKIPVIPDIIRDVLEDQALNPNSFNHTRMIEIIQRIHDTNSASMENHMAAMIYRSVVPDFLYTESGSELLFDRRVNSSYTIHHFLSQSAEFWKNVIKVCLLDTSWITVAVVPSTMLRKRLDEDETHLVAKRMDDENITETKRIAQRSESALQMLKMQNEYNYTYILEKFPLPSVHSIGLTNISRDPNPTWANDTVCNLYFDDVNSSYVVLNILLDTTELSQEEKKYLVLFSKGLLNSPYLDSSNVPRSAEELKAQLKKECLHYETSFGLQWKQGKEKREFTCGNYSHLLRFQFKFDASRTKEVFQLVHHILWDTVWQTEKLKEICDKLVMNAEKDLEGHGRVMANVLLKEALYTTNSVPTCISLVRQKILFAKVSEELANDKSTHKMLERIRSNLLKPKKCTIHVAGSKLNMDRALTEDPNVKDAVADVLKKTFEFPGLWGHQTKKLANASDMNFMKSLAWDINTRPSKGYIFMTETGHVGYLIQTSPGVRSYDDPDYPLALLSIQYFLQEGGPINKELVESGLTQDVDIRVSPSEGLIFFELGHCLEIAKAYKAASQVFTAHCSGSRHAITEEIWDDILLTSAKSAVIFQLTKEEDTPHHVARLSMLSYYRGIYELDLARRKLKERIADATMPDVKEATLKYLKPLFSHPGPCAASAPRRIIKRTIQELMESCGKKLVMLPPAEQSSLASYN